MTGKGDDVRKYDRKKFNENFDRIFGKRSARPTTKVTIEFDMEGNNHDLDTVYKRNTSNFSSASVTYDLSSDSDQMEMIGINPSGDMVAIDTPLLYVYEGISNTLKAVG